MTQPRQTAREVHKQGSCLMGLVWTTLGFGLLAAGAYETAGHGFRQPAGLARILAAVVIGWSWLTVGMELFGTTGVLSREALLGWSAAALAAGLACRALDRRDQDRNATASPPEKWGWVGTIAVWLTLWVVAIYAAGSLLYPVKVVSDGPIYHLYFAARWWKAHHLELVATPFGENAATYFPANGDLWFCWLMIVWGGDTLAKIGQGPFLLAAALAMVAIARRLGAGRAPTLIAVAWFLTSFPLLLFSFETNVDTIFIAGYLTGVYFFLRYALGDDGPSSVVLGALAAGLALGTKAIGVVFVPPLLVLASVPAVLRPRSTAHKLLAMMAVWLLPQVVAGFWFVRNYVLTGNPLYPLHLTVFGHVWLAGWYGPDVMRKSVYYIPVTDWRALTDQLFAIFDARLAPVWLAALGGAWFWRKDRHGREDVAVWGGAGLAVLNLALFWLVVPYRTQQRFALQAVALAAVPLARTFDRHLWLQMLGIALLGVHIFTPLTWPVPQGVAPPWDLSPLIPSSAPALIPIPLEAEAIRSAFTDPSAHAGLWATLAIGTSAFLPAWTYARLAKHSSVRRFVSAAAATLLFAIFTGTLLYPWDADPRRKFFASFRDYYRGWNELDIRSGPNGVKVAYAGTNLPYYLMGVGLRNDVQYINVDAHRDWLLHDYHREASRSGPATYEHPRPGWDRIHPDYDAWLANLRAAGIQILVVTRANPDEGPHNVADRYGFPVEYGWANAHPETFEVLYGPAERDALFRIYRLRPEGSKSG